MSPYAADTFKEPRKEETKNALDKSQHKLVTLPADTAPLSVGTAPPSQLLTLIGAFMSMYGLNSTSRIFILELDAKSKLYGWDDDVATKLEDGVPDLVKIYNEWFREWEGRQLRSDVNTSAMDTTSSSESDESDTGSSSSSDISSDSSSESDDSDTNRGATKPSKSTQPIVNLKVKAISSSNSDADDEKETITTPASTKSAGQDIKSGLKRKSSKSSSIVSSSDEDFDSDSEVDSDVPAKKKRKINETKKLSNSTTDASQPTRTMNTTPKGTKKSVSSSSGSSSDSSSSSSSSSSIDADESDSPQSAKVSSANPASRATASAGRHSSADSASSHTLKATSPTKSIVKTNLSSSTSLSPSYSSSSSSAVLPVSATAVSTPQSTKKRKRSQTPKASTEVPKKINTPFKRVPLDIKIDVRLASNKYVPYDYADRAHQDLSVTKGKGFTKEKNKKKRGS